MCAAAKKAAAKKPEAKKPAVKRKPAPWGKGDGAIRERGAKKE